MEVLNDITEFKTKCIKSVRMLKSETNDVINEILENNTLLTTPTIKEEVTIFVEELQVEVPQPPLPAPTKRRRKLKAQSKKFTTVKKRSQKKPVSKKIATQSVKAYCHVCCYDHIYSQEHAIKTHSQELEDGILKCLLCEENSYNLEEFLNHLEAKHKEFEFAKKCSKCDDFSTKNRKEFAKHMQTNHYIYSKMNRVYPCDFCEKIYNKHIKLRYHMHRHFGAIKCR